MAVAALNPGVKKLIFVTPGPLLPITNGQRSTAFQLICELSRLCELECVLVIRPNTVEGELLQTITELKKFSVPTTTVRAKSWSTAKSVARYLIGRICAPLRNAIFSREHLAINNDEPVLFFGSTFDPMAQIIGEHDFREKFFFPADSIALYQNNVQASGSIAQIIKKIKGYLSKLLERGITRLYDRNFYVSKRDSDFVKDFCPAARVEVVPIGTRPPNRAKEYLANARQRVIFTGVMNYTPNFEGAKFLIKEVVPLLKDLDIEFVLAGLNPPEELVKLATGHESKIKVLGAVPSIEEEILSSELYVSPLFSGAGAKNKVLTALGCGVPVLGTAESFSGFNTLPPGAIVTGPSATEFANGIRRFISLSLRDKQSLGASARKTIIERFSWGSSAKTLLSKI